MLATDAPLRAALDFDTFFLALQSSDPLSMFDIFSRLCKNFDSLSVMSLLIRECDRGHDISVGVCLISWLLAVCPTISDLQGWYPLARSLKKEKIELAFVILDNLPTEYNTSAQIELAFQSGNEDLVLRCLSRPKTSAAILAGGGDIEGDCEDKTRFELWAARAIECRMLRVVTLFYDNLPALREHIFLYIAHTEDTSANLKLWDELLGRFKQDKTWMEQRGAFLVQQRCVGLDSPIGYLIASFVYEFDEMYWDEFSDTWCDKCSNMPVLCSGFGCKPTRRIGITRAEFKWEPSGAPPSDVSKADEKSVLAWGTRDRTYEDTRVIAMTGSKLPYIGYYKSMIAMPYYAAKSTEELRYEDYMASETTTE
ncbi:Aste57867_21749 [Aphanomyces stellatus]|uniref:Aste57867_21749 protein n=1 Tax=Aphanomyces stellatus TaxID=120398 RepID=A0A485LIC6_9STRA|nr:hypothetical protein As57867_021680 [Aphanomyces stellatus]VFT98418.1 Aste57867_21749 [Aphanomyces stellatus]